MKSSKIFHVVIISYFQWAVKLGLKDTIHLGALQTTMLCELFSDQNLSGLKMGLTHIAFRSFS